MNSTPKALIYIITVTISFLTALYMISLSYVATTGAEIPQTTLQSFNHAGDVLLGAIIGFLVKTNTMPDKPIETVVVNAPGKPVQVEDQSN